MSKIYKLLTPQEWELFQHNSRFVGSPMDVKDGFIHCSYEHQYPRIKEKFFNKQATLVLLEIDTQKLLDGQLKIESNHSGGNEYPHVYGTIPLGAVVSWTVLS